MKSLDEIYKLIDELNKKELFDEANQIKIKAQNLYISKVKELKKRTKEQADYTE